METNIFHFNSLKNFLEIIDLQILNFSNSNFGMFLVLIKISWNSYFNLNSICKRRHFTFKLSERKVSYLSANKSFAANWQAGRNKT